jgi:hypothetical protein
MSCAQITTIFSWEDFQRMKASLVELKLKLNEVNLTVAKQLSQNHPEYARTIASTVSLLMVVNHNIDKIYLEVDQTIDKVLTEIAPQGAT